MIHSLYWIFKEWLFRAVKVRSLQFRLRRHLNRRPATERSSIGVESRAQSSNLVYFTGGFCNDFTEQGNCASDLTLDARRM